MAAVSSGSSPLPWPSPSLRGSAPSCSPSGANISTLQDSLYVTGCCFAPLSPGDTTLQHSQSPDCIGCLLRGSLAITTIGLHLHNTTFGAVQVSPTSRRQLSGHTSEWIGSALIGLELTAFLPDWANLLTQSQSAIATYRANARWPSAPGNVCLLLIFVVFVTRLPTYE